MIMPVLIQFHFVFDFVLQQQQHHKKRNRNKIKRQKASEWRGKKRLSQGWPFTELKNVHEAKRSVIPTWQAQHHQQGMRKAATTMMRWDAKWLLPLPGVEYSSPRRAEEEQEKQKILLQSRCSTQQTRCDRRHRRLGLVYTRVRNHKADEHEDGEKRKKKRRKWSVNNVH